MTQVTARRGRTRRTDEKPRPTREQRVARGKAARAEVPRSSHAEFTAAARAARPGDPPRGPGRSTASRSCCRSGTGGWRPRRSRSSAVRRCRWPATWPRTPRSGLDRPGVRGRPPVELRGVRLARAASRLRHQRLRRDPARTVGMGRQAAGDQPGDRRSRATASPTKERRGIVLAAVAAYRRAMREFADMDALEVWYAHADAPPSSRGSSRSSARLGASARCSRATSPRRRRRTTWGRSAVSPASTAGSRG